MPRTEALTVATDPKTRRFSLDIDDDAPAFGEARVPQPQLERFDVGRFTSAAVLAWKAKQFDDGLTAALALAADAGCGKLPSKRRFAERMPFEPEYDIPPLGVYTWSPDLERIFWQDRGLQKRLGHQEASAVAELLRSEPELLQAYEALTAFQDRFVNPPARADLRALLRGTSRGPFAIFSGARTPEHKATAELTRRDDTQGSVVDELFRMVRAGELDLQPAADSGWYDYMIASLEPLLLPDKTAEAERLTFSSKYREHLETLARAVLAFSRETHVKDLDLSFMMGLPKERPLTVYPGLTVEPTAEHYLRRARAYEFLEHVLEEHIGSGALRGLRRLRPHGQSDRDLLSELQWMRRLFESAHATVMQEVGLADPDPVATKPFRTWQSRAARDLDISVDGRTMVPIARNEATDRFRVLAFLGWSAVSLRVAWADKPRITVLNAEGERMKVQVMLGKEWHWLPQPVTAEVEVENLLNREEFQAHCDRYRTVDAILEHLA